MADLIYPIKLNFEKFAKYHQLLSIYKHKPFPEILEYVRDLAIFINNNDDDIKLTELQYLLLFENQFYEKHPFNNIDLQCELHVPAFYDNLYRQFYKQYPNEREILTCTGYYFFKEIPIHSILSELTSGESIYYQYYLNDKYSDSIKQYYTTDDDNNENNIYCRKNPFEPDKVLPRNCNNIYNHLPMLYNLFNMYLTSCSIPYESICYQYYNNAFGNTYLGNSVCVIKASFSPFGTSLNQNITINFTSSYPYAVELQVEKKTIFMHFNLNILESESFYGIRSLLNFMILKIFQMNHISKIYKNEYNYKSINNKKNVTFDSLLQRLNNLTKETPNENVVFLEENNN